MSTYRYALTETLCSGVIAAAAQAAKANPACTKSFQASGTTSAGAGAATIKIQGSNDNGANWVDIGTIGLTLATTTSSDGFTSDDRFGVIRANVTAISGTTATVAVTVGY